MQGINLYFYRQQHNMRRFNYIIIFLLLFAGIAQAQVSKDPVIVKKYRGDTLHFLPFPKAILLDSIRPAKGITSWELNTIKPTGNNSSTFTVLNLYRYRSPGSIDTVYATASTGFSTICPPQGCAWYIAAIKNKKPVVVTNLKEMSGFIDAIDNKYDAYLWLQSQSLAESRTIPLKTSREIFYRRVKDGYLLKMNMRISDCHITYADVTYFVGNDKKVVLIRSVVTSVSPSCI